MNEPRGGGDRKTVDPTGSSDMVSSSSGKPPDFSGELMLNWHTWFSPRTTCLRVWDIHVFICNVRNMMIKSTFDNETMRTKILEIHTDMTIGKLKDAVLLRNR